MNSKLFISKYESATQTGFLSLCMAKALSKNKDYIIELLPDFSAINVPTDIMLSKDDEYEDFVLDTIIQYLPIEQSELHSGYKNIIVHNPPHFATKKPSIKNKIRLFDEIWVWDQNTKIFLEDLIESNKIKVIGYPFNPHIFPNISKKIKRNSPPQNFNFYTVITESQLGNLERLIFNFAITFNRSTNVRLSIFLDHNYLDDTKINQKIKNSINKVKDSLNYIKTSVVDNIVVVRSGNIWVNFEEMLEFHTEGDCYINLDYSINPHCIIAKHLEKYSLSICNYDKLLYYNPDNIIITNQESFRVVMDKDKTYFNEYNLYPLLSDHSVKSKLLNIYQNFIKGEASSFCYLEIEKPNYFL